MDFAGERSLCRDVPHAPSNLPALPALQLGLVDLCEELEMLALAPLAQGTRGVAVAIRIAELGRDIEALASACAVLARRADADDKPLD